MRSSFAILLVAMAATLFPTPEELRRRVEALLAADRPVAAR